MRAVLVLLLVLGASRATAHAQGATENPTKPAEDTVVPSEAVDAAEPPPPVEPTTTPPMEKPETAADVAGAPEPGLESGRTDRVDPGDGTGRKVGRALLWVPRLPIELLVQPTRGVLYLKDRYHLFDVITGLFTTEDKKIAIFPTAMVETGFGFNVGVRARFRDLLGHNEKLRVRASAGGRFRTLAEAELESDTTRTVSGGLLARMETRKRERFYGIGNGDLVAAPMTPIDPTLSDDAIGSLYQVKALRIAPYVRVQLPHSFTVAALAAYLRDDVGPSDATTQLQQDAPTESIDQYYATGMLPGYGKRTSLYTEVEVALDTRRQAHRYDPPAIRGTGGLVAAFVGRHEGFGDSRTFYRGGLDVQRYIALTKGPRVLELRVRVEGVSAPRDQVPFLELPRLGGERMLRGYDRDRFRDRYAAVAQVGYLFALSRAIAGSLFVDAGRVFGTLDEVSLADPRVGFGGALEVYSRRELTIRAELASSIDGGLFAYVSLAPAWDVRPRTERR